MKCDMSVETEVALKKQQIVSDFIPRTEEAGVGLEKNVSNCPTHSHSQLVNVLTLVQGTV